MEQVKALNALEPFLALSKSATSPLAAADLITRATSYPSTFIFTELLDTPQIQALSASPDQAPQLDLLKIFSYGTYADYVASQSSLPALNEAQTKKLRQLTLLTLAKTPSELKYAKLIASLGLNSPKELEDLVISAIYTGLLAATLDPYKQNVCVSSVAPLRDVAPGSIQSMLGTLNEWSSRCVSTLAGLEKQIATIRADAAKRDREGREWEAHLETLVEAQQMEGEEKDNKGGLMGNIGRKLGMGAASKRGSGMMGLGGAEQDERMDIDDDDDDGPERRKLAKKRGFSNT